MSTTAAAIHKAARQARDEAFDAGRWFSTFCHAPKGSVWHPSSKKAAA